MDKKGIFCALISSATFGLITLFIIPIIKSEMLNNISILFYRLLFATIGVGVASLFRGERFSIVRRDTPKILILGAFYSLTALFLLLAYTKAPTDSGIFTAMHYLYPVVVMLIMTLAFKEKISYKIVLLALTAIVGVALLTIKEGVEIDKNSILGVIFVLLSVITYGIYIVGTNKLGVSYIPPMILTFYVLLSGTFIVGVYGLLTMSIEAVSDLNIFLNLLLLAVICTVISNLTLIIAVKRIGSTLTSILGAIEPIAAVVVGVVIFSEKITLTGYIGIALIITSAVLAVLRRK